MNLAKYKNLTQAEIDAYVATLDMPLPEVTVHKWAGEPFNGLSPETIRQHHGENFYVVEIDGQFSHLSIPEDVTGVAEAERQCRVEAACEAHFADRLRPEPVPLPEEEAYRCQSIINQEYLIALAEINNL